MVDPWAGFYKGTAELNNTLQQIPQNQLARMQLAQGQQALEDEQRTKQIMMQSQGDQAGAARQLYGQGLYKPAMAMEKSALERQGSQITQQEGLHKLRMQSAQEISALPDDQIQAGAIAAAKRTAAITGTDPTQAIQMFQNMTPTQIREGAMKQALPMEKQTLSAADILHSQTARRGQDLAEQGRILTNDLNERRLAFMESKLSPTGKDYVAEFGAKGFDVTALRTKTQKDSFNAAAKFAEDNGYEFNPTANITNLTQAKSAASTLGKYETPQVTAKTAAETESAFANKRQGDTTRALNVAISHLGYFDQLIDSAANEDSRTFNKISNEFKKEFGLSEAPTNLQAAKLIVGNEVAKAILRGEGSEKEREAFQKSLSEANTPTALKGVIKTYQGLLGGQLTGLETQYKVGGGSKNFRKDFLSKETQRVLGPLADTANGGGGQTKPPPINAAGWKLHKDAKGNMGYVSPDGKSVEEVK